MASTLDLICPGSGVSSRTMLFDDAGASPQTIPLAIRGLHLDPCRHFIHPETVLRIIDVMAQLKLNLLHLHLSDDQGLPVTFECAPHIGTQPAYSIEAQQRIARACADRNIEVVVELDMPGHCHAFLSSLEPQLRPEERLGIISDHVIDLDHHLPPLLTLFDELVSRFGCRRIHMGGDEAPRFQRYPELIARVCAWAHARRLQVVAWDDVLAYLTADQIPSNLVIQRWRRETSSLLDRVPVIQSRGFYLDRIDDPFAYYHRSLPPSNKLLGCVACLWTELVTDETLERTLFPSLYMLAHRWWTYPHKHPHPPSLLKQLCARFGLPSCGQYANDWRIRRWAGFYRDDPRSTSSVTVHTLLNRDQDLVPAFGPHLVDAADGLYRFWHLDEAPSPATRRIVNDLSRRALRCDFEFVWARTPGWRAALLERMRTCETDLRYRNGFLVAIRWALAPVNGDPDPAESGAL